MTLNSLRKISLYIGACLIISTMMGCSHIYGPDGLVYNNSQDYVHAYSEPRLKLPKNYDNGQFVDYYPMPALVGNYCHVGGVSLLPPGSEIQRVQGGPPPTIPAGGCEMQTAQGAVALQFTGSASKVWPRIQSALTKQQQVFSNIQPNKGTSTFNALAKNVNGSTQKILIHVVDIPGSAKASASNVFVTDPTNGDLRQESVQKYLKAILAAYPI